MFIPENSAQERQSFEHNDVWIIQCVAHLNRHAVSIAMPYSYALWFTWACKSIMPSYDRLMWSHAPVFASIRIIHNTLFIKQTAD